MKKETLLTVFEKFNSLTALVVGDVMMDAYYWGKVERISPEAPVPVVHVQHKENRLGGAANVALNVQSLGAKAIICSVVGDGAQGDVFRKILHKSGFTTEGIIDSTERMTTVKTRVISGGHHIVRIDEEMTDPLSATDERNLLNCIHDILQRQKIDVIIFEDYNKGVLTEKIIKTLLQWAEEMHIPTAVDPKKEHFLSYTNCTLFKPNLKELKEGLNVNIDRAESDSLRQAMTQLREILGNQYTMVTLSDKGIITHNGEAFFHVPAYPREILDVSGAGDTVISVAALALAGGLTQEEFSQLANLAGGLVCEKTGVVPIEKSLLLSKAMNLLS